MVMPPRPPLLLLALFRRLVITAPLRTPTPKRTAERASCSLWRWTYGSAPPRLSWSATVAQFG